MISMRTFTGNRLDAALFASGIVQILNTNLLSIMITFLEKSGDCFVSVATNSKSDAIVESLVSELSKRSYNTLTEITPAG